MMLIRTVESLQGCWLVLWYIKWWLLRVKKGKGKTLGWQYRFRTDNGCVWIRRCISTSEEGHGKGQC